MYKHIYIYTHVWMCVCVQKIRFFRHDKIWYRRMPRKQRNCIHVNIQIYWVIYLNACAYIEMYTCERTDIHTWIHIHIHVKANSYVYAITYKYILTHDIYIHVYMNTHTFLHRITCIHIHIYVLYVYTHTYTYT